MSLLAVVAAAAIAHPGCCAGCSSYGRLVATPRAYPSGMVDSVSRPGFNGREWTSRPVTAQPGPFARDSRSAAYGAYGQEGALVYIRVGHVITAISPWESFESDGQQRFEHARGQWLKENGYVGGVRTFRRDGPAMAEDSGEGASAPILPRAIFPAPPRRPTPGYEVRAAPGGPVTRVSLPDWAPADLADRLAGGQFDAGRPVADAGR